MLGRAVGALFLVTVIVFGFSVYRASQGLRTLGVTRVYTDPFAELFDDLDVYVTETEVVTETATETASQGDETYYVMVAPSAAYNPRIKGFSYVDRVDLLEYYAAGSGSSYVVTVVDGVSGLMDGATILGPVTSYATVTVQAGHTVTAYTYGVKTGRGNVTVPRVFILSAFEGGGTAACTGVSFDVGDLDGAGNVTVYVVGYGTEGTSIWAGVQERFTDPSGNVVKDKVLISSGGFDGAINRTFTPQEFETLLSPGGRLNLWATARYDGGSTYPYLVIDFVGVEVAVEGAPPAALSLLIPTGNPFILLEVSNLWLAWFAVLGALSVYAVLRKKRRIPFLS